VPSEADAQTSGRRRRRRGSRRRSDRLGLSAEDLAAEAANEEADEGDGVEDGEDLTAVAEDELAPLDGEEGSDVAEDDVVVATDVEGAEALASDLAAAEVEAEAIEAEAVAEAVEIEGAPVDAVVVDTTPLRVEVVGVPEVEAEPEAEATPAEEAPVARERRPRRTRRRVTDTPTEAEPVADAVSDGAGAVPLQPPLQSEDIEPAPLPDEATVNGASSVEETPAPAAEPVRRPRRVASASRGRSRRP
jgi:hypothetical protein